MKAKTRHWFIYQQPCFRFHIFAIHLIGVRIMPLAGRDVISSQRTSLQTLFQSTRPLRGATLALVELVEGDAISIHAPLAGRDLCAVIEANRQRVFQSTRPLRGATPTGFLPPTVDQFQSTRPLRGATPTP